MFIPYESKFDQEIEKLLKQAPYYLLWGVEASSTLLAVHERKIIGIGSL